MDTSRARLHFLRSLIIVISLVLGTVQPVNAGLDSGASRSSPSSSPAAAPPSTPAAVDDSPLITISHNSWIYQVSLQGKDGTFLEQGTCSGPCTKYIEWRGRGVIAISISATYAGGYPDNFISRETTFSGVSGTGSSDLPSIPFTISNSDEYAYAEGTVDLDVLPNYDMSRGVDWGLLDVTLNPSVEDTYLDPDTGQQTVTHADSMNLFLYLHQSAFIKIGDIDGALLQANLIRRDGDFAGQPVTLESDTFDVYPSSAYTDESGSANFLVTPKGGGPLGDGQTSIQGMIQASSEDIDTPPVLKQAYFAKVIGVSGKVVKRIGATTSDVAAGDILPVGSFIRLDASDWTSGYKPFIRIAFSDGSNITAEQELQGSEHITEFEVGEGALTGGDLNMVNTVLVPGTRLVVESAAICYALGPLGLGFWATRAVGGGVRKLFVDPIIDHFLSPGGLLRQANSPLATGDSALTNSRLVFTVDSASVLHVENWGQVTARVTDDAGASMLLPAGTLGDISADSTGYPTPASLNRGLGTSFALTSNLVQSENLTTQTPTVSLYYTSTDTILPGSLQGRLNGRLFTNGLLPGASQTTYAVAPQNLLNEGSNRLRAAVQTDKGEWSTLDLTFTASAAPETPFGLRATAATGKVLLDWQPNPEGDLAGYRIYTSTTETGPTQLLTTTLLTQPVLLDAHPGSFPHWYRVAAVDTAGHASPQTAAVLAAPPLLPGTASAPGSFAAAPGDGLVTISFVDEDPSALAWRLERAPGSGGDFATLAWINRSGFVDRSVANGSAYRYRLVPVGSNLADGAPATAGPVTPQDLAPAAPAGLTAWMQQERVTLEWDPPAEAGVVGYRIWRAEPGLDFSLRSPGTVTGAIYTDTVTLDHLYAWQVTALDATGHESAASAVVQLAARRSDTPYIPQISPVTGGYVDVYAGGLIGPPYPLGTQLRLTPHPDSGYRFVSWSGDISGSQNPLVFVLNSNIALTPRFEPIPTPGALPVTTFAGTGAPGADNGTALSASFYNPSGVALDGSGNLFVVDSVNQRIRKIDTSGAVTTFAGSSFGFLNGNGTAARFANPHGIAVDTSGNVYVADTDNNAIRKITPAGAVTTLAGSGTPGWVDGAGATAQFMYPLGLVVDSGGNVYVADTMNGRIRKITPGGVVSTWPNNSTYFQEPRALALGLDGTTLYIAEASRKIRQMTAAGVVSLLAGSGQAGSQDGLGSAASFALPAGLARDAEGVLWVADQNNHRLRRITPQGLVTTVTGSVAGFQDGLQAQFSYPVGVAIDPAGRLFVADMNNQRIRLVNTRPSALLTPGAGGVLSVIASTRTITVTFPAGAVSTPLTLYWTPDASDNLPAGLGLAGAPFSLVARDGSGNLVTNFAHPFTLVIHYTGDDLNGLDEATLDLYVWNAAMSRWDALGATLDTVSHTLTISLDHLSRFAVLGGLPQTYLYLPLVRK